MCLQTITDNFGALDHLRIVKSPDVRGWPVPQGAYCGIFNRETEMCKVPSITRLPFAEKAALI